MNKCLRVLENDSIADKMEKSRKGNGLDGKRRGPAISVLSNRRHGDFSFSWHCHSLEMEEWVSGEGPGLRLSCVVVILKPRAERRPRGGLHRRSPGPGGAWATLTSTSGRGKHGRSSSVGRWGGLEART